MRSSQPSVSLLDDALEEDLLRLVRVCDSGCDVQSVRKRLLSSESDDEDRAFEPCVSQLTHVDARRCF